LFFSRILLNSKSILEIIYSDYIWYFSEAKLIWSIFVCKNRRKIQNAAWTFYRESDSSWEPQSRTSTLLGHAQHIPEADRQFKLFLSVAHRLVRKPVIYTETITTVV